MDRPIFVVGCPRSGTTLVRTILNTHPNLSSGPETHFLASLAEIERSGWHQLWLYGFTQEEWHSQVRDLFTRVHTQLAEREGKPRWVDKTPGYALILDYIDQLYPDCQVIHVIRNPRDVIDSWRRRWGFKRAGHAVGTWSQHVRAARAFGDRHSADRYKEIRYEELVSTPKEVLVELLSWLHEPWDDDVLDLTRPTSLRTKRRNAGGMKERRDEWLGKSVRTEPVLENEQARTGKKRSEIMSSSVGVGIRGQSRILNVPYFVQLELTCRDLVKELGYA
ncbi:MAG: sulfotransferase family protein [Acidimicrobiales bacterium]